MASFAGKNDTPSCQALIAEFYENLLERRYVEAGNMCKLMTATIGSVSPVEVEMIKDCKSKFSNAVIAEAIGLLKLGDLNSGIDLLGLSLIHI